MIQRLYNVILILIFLFVPYYILTNIDYQDIVQSTYNAKCVFNNEYVVLQGAALNEYYQFDEIIYVDKPGISDTKRTLNFYCQYYDDIRPYIIASSDGSSFAENSAFFEFKNSVYSDVTEYPKYYELVVIDEQFNHWAITGPVVDALTVSVGIFILLYIVKNIYMYVAIGKINWNPIKVTPKK